MVAGSRTHPEPSPARTAVEEARRARLVECAIVVLAEQGYGGATLSAISERCGVTKGVIAYYFRGKADLLSEVERQITQAMEAVIVPRMEAEPTARGQLLALLRAQLEYMRDHREHLLALIELYFMNARAESRQPAYETLGYEPIYAALEELFACGQQTGEFAEFDGRVMAIATWGAVEGVFTQWAARPDINFDRHIEELIRMVDRATRRNEE